MACMREKAGVVGSMSEDVGALAECEGKALMTSDYTGFQVCCSGYFGAGIGRSSWEDLSTGCREKAPRFIVHAAGWLHSMVLHRCSCG